MKITRFLWVMIGCFLAQRECLPARCSQGECAPFELNSVREIVDILALKPTDVVVVLDDDEFVAQAISELQPVKELIAVIKDQDACDTFNKNVQDAPHTQVICGGLADADLLSATVIIALSPAIKPQELLAKIVNLPDGVKVLTRHQLDVHESLHLEAIRSIATSELSTVLMYEYLVKRPTVAEVLQEMYRGMTGYGISQEEADSVRKVGGDPTYGEIEFPSAEEIFTKIVPITAHDVFYDLGCGIGKLATWIYLATPAKKVVAIELSDSRYKVALEAQKLMRETVLPKRKAIMRAEWGELALRKTFDVVQGDIAEADLHDATVIYMCSTCYPDLLMQKMVDKFVTLKEGLRIVTLKELPAHPSIHAVGTPQRFKMSWSLEKGSPVYIYEMRHPKLKDVLDKAYEGIDGFSIPEEEKEEVRKQGGAPTYGEITYDSAKILFRDILKIKAGDVFCDLGAGTGKVALQAYLETPATKIIGVELSPKRFADAQTARERVEKLLQEEPYQTLWQQKWGEVDKLCDFRHENIMNTDLTGVTKIFTCATCFSAELMDSIAGFCRKLPQGARIASLKKLSECSELALVKTHKLAMSWSNSVEVYEYVVGAEAAPKASAKKTPAKKAVKPRSP